jgi:hypothetical protein
MVFIKVDGLKIPQTTCNKNSIIAPSKLDKPFHEIALFHTIFALSRRNANTITILEQYL